MTPRPTTLKILNLHWPVKWIAKEIDGGTQKFAWTDLNQQILFMPEGLSPGKTADSFLHEIFHALWWSFCLKANTEEEEVCNLLSSGLLTVWMDNPEAFAWLQETILSSPQVPANGDGPRWKDSTFDELRRFMAGGTAWPTS